MSPDQDYPQIIADRAEFAESLRSLRRGHVMVRMSEGVFGCCIDGAPVYHSFDTLRDYGLVEAFDNRFGFPGIEYWRITERGREFADRVWSRWRAHSPIERMVVRLTG
jgi:hypothetical protein